MMLGDSRESPKANGSNHQSNGAGEFDVDEADESSPFLRQSSGLLKTKLKSALSLFSLGSSNYGQGTEETEEALKNDDISATFVVSDDEDSDEDENGDSIDTKPRRAIRSPSMSNGGAAKTSKSSPRASHRLGLILTPSFVQSMNQYMIRRTLAEEAVGAGHTFAEIGEEKLHPAQQADLNMYTIEKQLMRSKIKRSTRFQADVRSLWALVAPHGLLSKSQYIKMITKFSRLIVPPPWAPEDVLQTAMDDWGRDLAWAQDHGLVTKDAKELNYDSFFKSIYELVDLWTETANEEEYLEMLARLICGVSEHDRSGSLRWRPDANIVYDSYFSMHSSEENAEQQDSQEKLEKEEIEEEVNVDPAADDEFDDIGPSLLEPLVDQKKTKKRGRLPKPKEGPLVPENIINARIAQLYQKKQQADLYSNSKANGKPIRFDRFVLHAFAQQHGTRGSARRHLRAFVTSIQRYLNEPDGAQAHPRMYVFSVLSGIVTLPPLNEFNPRLSAEYFQPALRSLFPNPRVIERVFSGKEDPRSSPAAMRLALEKACIPGSLSQIMGGPFAIENFKRKLKAGGAKKMPDLDQSFALALDLWLFSDSLRFMRERAAIHVLRRFFAAHRPTNRSALLPPAPLLPGRLHEAIELDAKLNPAEGPLLLEASTSDPENGPLADALAPQLASSPTVSGSGSTGHVLVRAGSMPMSRDPGDPRVAALLESIGIGKYVARFFEEEVDMAGLRMMSEHDFAELGLTKGARVKLREAIKALPL